MSRLSIIVPVYNAEKYLKQCVDSILNQSYRDIELLLVDDGSGDASADICRQYQKKDNRVVYLREANAGTSAARNFGLRKAEGEYVTFADNDDFLADNDAYRDIMALLDESHADVLMFNTSVYDNRSGEISLSGGNIKREEVMGKSAGEALKAVMNHGSMARAVWSKVFKRQFLEDNHIVFPAGMRNEDTAFSADVFLHAESYDWYDKVFYRYRVNTGSSQTSEPLNKAQLDDLRSILIHYIKESEKLKDGQLQSAVYSYLAFPFAVWLGYASHNKEVSRQEIKEMKPYAFVMKYNEDSSMRQVSKLYTWGGYELVRHALSAWVALKRRH